MNRNVDYWRERFLDIKRDTNRSTRDVVKETWRINHRAKRQIQRDINRFVERYAMNDNISFEEANRVLSKAEQETWRMELAEFRQKAIDGGFKQELDREYFRSRISRLQRLKTQIDMHIAELADANNKLLDTHVRDVISDTYWRKTNLILGDNNLSSNFAKYNTRMVERLAEQPFHGKHFSERIWGSHRDKLTKELKNILSDGVMRGDNIQQMTRAVADQFEVSRARAATLVRTEAGHLAEQATLQSYADTDTEKYEFLASLEDNMCTNCHNLHEEWFRVQDAEEGRNYPLKHPNCVCTTVPLVADWDDILTDDEIGAVNRYTSAEAYTLNEKLRNRDILTQAEHSIVSGLDSALNKTVNYQGFVSRSLEFSNRFQLERFLSSHQVGKRIEYGAFTSFTSSGVHNQNAQIQLHVDSIKGKDIRSFNPGENEVLYRRGSIFNVKKIEIINGVHHILLEEG